MLSKKQLLVKNKPHNSNGVNHSPILGQVGPLNKLKNLFSILFLFIFCINAYAQEVSNVTFRQIDYKKLEISYDLLRLEPNLLEIQLFVSNNGGKTFRGPLKMVSGQVGDTISEGSGRKIIWNAYEEFGELSGQVNFKVVCKYGEKYKPKRIGAYLEGFGSAIEGSFNVEYVLINKNKIKIAIKSGIGITKDVGNLDPNSRDKLWESFPFGVNLIFFEKNHHLEIGYGYLLYPMGNGYDFENFLIGYRYQKTGQKGLLIRMGITYNVIYNYIQYNDTDDWHYVPISNDLSNLILPHISIGYNF